LATEQGGDEVELEEANEAPVDTANNEQNGCEYVD
jgi:hypothetical protein